MAVDHHARQPRLSDWPQILLFAGVAAAALTAVALVALNVLTAPVTPRGLPLPPPSAGPSSSAPAQSPAPSPTPSVQPSPSPSPVCSYGPIGQFLCVSPTSASAGSEVTVSGYAPDCESVAIISAALASPTEFAGVPAVSVAPSGGRFSITATTSVSAPPGRYPVTVRACGGNLGVEVDLTIS